MDTNRRECFRANEEEPGRVFTVPFFGEWFRPSVPACFHSRPFVVELNRSGWDLRVSGRAIHSLALAATISELEFGGHLGSQL
jgi:hypothetical protein